MGRSRHFIDTQYGIRKVGEELMIRDSPMFINTDENFTNRGTAIRGTEGLWELWTRKNVCTEVINTGDLKTYKKLLINSNAHLTDISL